MITRKERTMRDRHILVGTVLVVVAVLAVMFAVVSIIPGGTPSKANHANAYHYYMTHVD
jgi:hypothetical protein